MTINKLRKVRTTRKGLVRKLDKLVSEIVILADGKCVVCGSTKSLTCGHLFSRVAYSTRWDLLNCHCQCLSCNFRHEMDSYPFTKWFLNKYGEEQYDDLHREYETPRQFKDWQLQILYDELLTVKRSLDGSTRNTSK